MSASVQNISLGHQISSGYFNNLSDKPTCGKVAAIAIAFFQFTVLLPLTLIMAITFYATKPPENNAPSTVPTPQTPQVKPGVPPSKGSKDHVSGGIIPYHIAPDGTAYLLLAKEGAGTCANLWCDFGGMKESNEDTIQTAAREGWEESKDFLGTQAEIQQKISANKPVGMMAQKNKHAMYFMKVDNKDDSIPGKFKAKQFKDHHRNEKTEVAWVKATDVFNGIITERRQNPKQKTYHNPITINGSPQNLRGCFAQALFRVLTFRNHADERTNLITILGQQNIPKPL